MKQSNHAIRACALALGVLAGVGGAAALDIDSTIPTPRVVIYPGDLILDQMLADTRTDLVVRAIGNIVQQRQLLIGKVARRTLLPGQGIPSNAVENPRLIANGSEVKLVFEEGALSIITFGTALQDGSLGDVVRVRNTDSGLTIAGIVQPDGSVRVRGS